MRVTNFHTCAIETSAATRAVHNRRKARNDRTPTTRRRRRSQQPGTVTVTVRDAVVDLMRRFGMTSVFANPGSTELPMFRDFPADFRYVLGLQEATVVGMADGYACATQKRFLRELAFGGWRGQCDGQHLHRSQESHADGHHGRPAGAFDPPFRPIPVFGANHRTPKPYVKWSIEPARAQDVPQAIARAYYIAMMPPRGPVLVSVPVDDWDQPAEFVPARVVSTELRPQPALGTNRRRAGCKSSAGARRRCRDRSGQCVERGRGSGRGAQRPCVGSADVRPVQLPEDHRLFAGFLPAMRERIVELLGDHDLILAIGAPAFAYHVEGAGPHIPSGATLCQLTEDPDTAAWTPVGMSAVGSIRLGVLDLLARPAPQVRAVPPARSKHRRQSLRR